MSSLFFSGNQISLKKTKLFKKVFLRFFSFFFIYLFIVLFASCSCSGEAGPVVDGGCQDDDSGSGNQVKDEPGWKKITSSAPWSTRFGHESLVFDNKIWVLGGRSSTASTDIIWNSADGTNWEEVTPIGATWTPRYFFQAAVFDNKMWVIGGVDNMQYDDIWNTSDGTNWTQVTPTGDWPGGNSRQEVLVFDGKMWMLGKFFDNDVLKSTDGINWVKVNVVAPKWQIRIFHQTAAFENKMWVFGGDDGTDHFKEVWSSADGVNWAEHVVSNPDWKERKTFQMLPFDGELWILGGRADMGTYPYYDDIWTSANGQDWQEFSTGGPWAARSLFQVVEFNGKLWLMGGLDSAGNHYNDVWRFSK